MDVSCATSYREVPEPENLLEECWFFGNLLIDSKSKTSKSNSDLGLSSNYNTREEIPSEGSMKDDNSHLPRLARGPSLPSCVEPKADMFHPVAVKERHDSGRTSRMTKNKLIPEESLPPWKEKDEDLPNCIDMMFHPGEKKHDLGGSNWMTQTSVIRKQSLPPRLRGQHEDEDEDEESDFMLGRLIRQASLNSSHILPPSHNSKAKSSSFSTKGLPRKRTEQLQGKILDMRDGTKIRRSISDIQTKEVKSFKTLSCVEDNCRDKTIEKIVNYPPTVPNWCDNEKRSSQDIKAEIKFWARAIASNMAAPSLSIANRN